MEPPSAAARKLHKQAQGLAPSHQEERRSADFTTFNENDDDLLIQQLEEVLRESPGARAVRELDLFNRKYPPQVTPTKSSVKVLERPHSSGDGVVATLKYQMPAPIFRPVQVKRPNGLSQSLNTVQIDISTSLEIDEPSQSKPSPGRPEMEPMKKIPESILADPPESESSKKHLARPATRGEDAAACPGQEKGLWQAPEIEETAQFEFHPASLFAQPDAQDLADVEQRKLKFNFAPATPSSENLSAATPRLLRQPESSARTVRVPAFGPACESNTKQSETVVPSIEVDSVRADDTLFEQPGQRVVRHGALTPNSKSNSQIPPPAPRARRQTSVLEGGIVKRPRSNVRARKPTPQRYSRPVDTEAPQPTEEDIYYLLMSRSHEAKDRERALEATQKRLRAQLHRLHEQNGTFQQQLTAASARSARQNAAITAYQAQIDDFKSKFTKFKAYARDLAQDYADMGKAMKHIGNTTNELIKDRADNGRSLESLHKSSASATALLIGLRRKISAGAREISSLQHALQLAEVKAQITDASLLQERLRNNRIETQMLGSQQVQERLSLSAMQEYRNAAGYLDDLCQAIIQLSMTVTKKQPSQDNPGVFQCLGLLKTLAEKQGTSITTLTEMKDTVGMISERQVIQQSWMNPSLTIPRLLSYNTSIKETTGTATSQVEKLSYDVICQITTSLGGLGPSISTEVNFATLRERAANLQKQVNMGIQMLNLAYDGKNASEKREKEQSIRVEKLLEQLAEANKRQEPATLTIAPPKPGLDIDLILTKYMQAGANLAAEQSKVSQKDGELHIKSTEILTVNEKLQTLHIELEASQASLALFREQDQRIRGQADAVIQENVFLKGQLEKLESSSLQATRVPGLINDLNTKDAELAQLRLKSVKVNELAQILTGKDAELKQLRLKADKVPLLVEDLNLKHTELNQQRLEAAKVPNLTLELVKLREKAATMSQLEEKVASTETQLNELRPKADQVEAKNALNILLQSNIHDHKNAIQLLENQLAGLNAQLGPIKRTAAEVVGLREQKNTLQTEATSLKKNVQSLENELKESRRLKQDIETLRKDLMALKTNWGNYDQLKKDLTAQKDVHAKHLAHVAGLQSKLEEAQAHCGQIPDLQGQLEELSQKCGILNQQLSEARKATEGRQTLQDEIKQKTDEIVLLKSKLKNFEETSHRPLAAREEIQQISGQLTASGEQITKLREHQRLLDSKKPEIYPAEEDDSIQQIMLDLQERMDREEQAHASDRLQSDPFVVRQDGPRRETAGQSFTTAGKNFQTRNSDHEAKIRIKDTNSTTQIPDSQAQISSLVVSSSPLSELENTSYVGRQDFRVGHPPSSSYGGDSMLLEDFEVVEGMLKESQVDSPVDGGLAQRHSHKSVGYGDASSRTLVADQGTRLSSRHQSGFLLRNVQESQAQEQRPSRLNVVPSSHTIVAYQGTRLGSRRPRRKISSQVIKETQSQERPSTPIASSSPAGPLKHLPNSSVKRPRLDSIETTPKRLKLTPSNLEVRNPSNRPTSSSTQITEPEPARPTRVSFPSGSRKGSVTGANAPAPAKKRGQKRLRKGTKSERYAERFSEK